MPHVLALTVLRAACACIHPLFQKIPTVFFARSRNSQTIKYPHAQIIFSPPGGKISIFCPVIFGRLLQNAIISHRFCKIIAQVIFFFFSTPAPQNSLCALLFACKICQNARAKNTLARNRERRRRRQAIGSSDNYKGRGNWFSACIYAAPKERKNR